MSKRLQVASVLFIWSAALTGSACKSDEVIEMERFQRRKLEHLREASATLDPRNVLNVIAHMERRRIDPTYQVAGVVPLDAWDQHLATVTGLEDGRDFGALALTTALLGYADDPMLAPGLTEKVKQAMLSVKYWYTEPTAPGKTDVSYYWTENHQVIYATIEYLVGQACPADVFTNDGRTGAQHRDSARERLRKWFEHRSRFGFSEWHSNVYYHYDIASLVTLVDFAQDPDIQVLAASMLDVLFFDLAVHNQKSAFGVTHGRSYKKDKLSSLDEDTWMLTRLLFDNANYPAQSGDVGDLLLARNHRYVLPEAIRLAGTSTEVTVDRERMGIAINEIGPVTPEPEAPYGLSYRDPAQLDLWWGMNAFATWPVVPLTIQSMEGYRLWDHPQLTVLQALRPYVDNPILAMTILTMSAPMTNFALLNEVNTYTWRSPDLMLSSAVDYRKGFKGAQVHSWQATLDARAIVFTNHPTVPLPESTNWLDDPEEFGGYWNGEASLPRSAQHENVGIYIYAPQYPITNGPPLEMFSYQPLTHAFFPQDRFDEVVRDANWTFGRLGDGYVALYSYRPAEFIAYDPQRHAMGGHTLPFDLVASGGADNVWIVEGGRRVDWGSFEAFRQAVAKSVVQVQSRGESARGVSPGYDVTYQSPSQGLISFGWEAPFVVRGEPQSLGPYPRFENPWAKVPFGSQKVTVEHGPYGVTLDFAAATREVYRREGQPAAQK